MKKPSKKQDNLSLGGWNFLPRISDDFLSPPLKQNEAAKYTADLRSRFFPPSPTALAVPSQSTHIFEDKYTHTMEEKMRKVISNPSSDVCEDMPGRT